jgi:hypothetical protein
MTATFASTATPPNAIPIWTDGLSLFTELPGPNGPVIIRYPLTSAGLTSALGLVRTRAYDTADRPVTPRDLPCRGTLEQQIAARDVVRNLLRKA